MPHRHSCGKTGVHPLRPVLVSLGILAACNHQDPFPNGDPAPNGPRGSTPPVQLTLSTGEDRSPSWQADGSAFDYALAREEGPAGDRCVGGMPAAGGTRISTKCLAVADSDTVRALGPIAAGPANKVAWLDARGLKTRKVPDRESIRIGTLAPSDTGIEVRTFPYPAPSGKVHATATSLTWITPTELAYIGTDRFLIGPCNGCKLDTVLVAREVVLLDLNSTPAGLTILPNSDEVTSVAASTDGLSLYFTRAGDTRVYQRVLASGAETTVHDFAVGIARDVNVQASVLTAVVGGRVSYGVDPLIGARQIDSGGALIRVDLTTGDELPIPVPGQWVQHPALSPDGRTVILEGLDSLRLRLADLWLVRLP
jgi:hypothetical protein